ncbi:MAG: hypothetical protein K6B52_01735 [Clostridiales bacterium]|nr:hypothetical protein [Clostridiales bacterium]
MKCPKCGGEIKFFDLRPNCRHCGVNIMYFTQNDNLIRDAKRTELESAAARMIIARIKAAFVGGKAQIIRIAAAVLLLSSFLIPFAAIYREIGLPLLNVSVLGLISLFKNGSPAELRDLVLSLPFPKNAVLCVVPALFALSALISVLIFAVLLLSFLDLSKSAKLMKNLALAGAVLSLAAQAAAVVCDFAGTGGAVIKAGFGAAVCFALFTLTFSINSALLKKGLEPAYREFDPKRRELLKKVRSGEISLDSLPLPVFESEEERRERLNDLERALKAEEEGKKS